MKKDELLSICRQQDRLLEEARQLLERKQCTLDRLLAAMIEQDRRIEAQAADLAWLTAENERLTARCAEWQDWQAEQERRCVTTIERLNEAWRTSCATWAAEWSERWNALSARLRTIEAASGNWSNESNGNWSAWNGDASPGPTDPPADPDDCERIVSEFVAGLMSDLERRLAG